MDSLHKCFLPSIKHYYYHDINYRSINMDKLVLLQLFRQPPLVKDISLTTWDYLIPYARQAGILGWMHQHFKTYDLLRYIPDQVYPHLEAAATVAAEHQRMVRWEVGRIRRALCSMNIPIILLKGAAYVMLDLPCAYGRVVADVDILVPKNRLGQVENALRKHNWETAATDSYDQKYYRQWMHELPPLRHRFRGTVVDVHHTILPLTNRLTPDPDLLFASVQPVNLLNAKEPEQNLWVLAPADIILHSSVHAFYDGDLGQCLRNLLDLHMLLLHFSGIDPRFWEKLCERAAQLGLQRPLFYALRYCQRFMHTPVPASVTAALAANAPGWLATKYMDHLLNRLLITNRAVIAQWLLYVRSHWLRMPPLLLAEHLCHKAYKRLHEYRVTSN
jgi:hypothetical protein